MADTDNAGNAIGSTDPLTAVLSAFGSIPEEFLPALFQDFGEAARRGDLRQLLDTISDWAATAEAYQDPEFAEDLDNAIGSTEPTVEDVAHYTPEMQALAERDEFYSTVKPLTLQEMCEALRLPAEMLGIKGG